MPRFIVTGTYTQQAMQGMIESPSDREKISRGLVEAVGGTQEAWFATTGSSDFMIVVTVDRVEDVISCLMVAGSSGAVANLQTQRAFTSAELTEMQKKAGTLASAYSAPG
ncbi:GYD domain-containing protein [Tropicimonas marinistellae]|uniref:GYD domain-containing protein n=1 Tax=Tropicimonas marinistellae TaxID=1739787 RepID=UPI000830B807|nr:GYD domain-containing protein [Tropicimonas marinistellae]